MSPTADKRDGPLGGEIKPKIAVSMWRLVRHGRVDDGDHTFNSICERFECYVVSGVPLNGQMSGRSPYNAHQERPSYFEQITSSLDSSSGAVKPVVRIQRVDDQS
jgi:hypothetical protein